MFLPIIEKGLGEGKYSLIGSLWLFLSFMVIQNLLVNVRFRWYYLGIIKLRNCLWEF